MYRQILSAVALQQWEEFTPHAVAAREVAAVLAKGFEAKLSVLSLYTYGKIEEPSLSVEMATRYREDEMRRIDASMETKMKTFLAVVQGADISIMPMLQAGESRKTIIDVAMRLPTDLLVIGAHSKRSVFDVGRGGTARVCEPPRPLFCDYGDATGGSHKYPQGWHRRLGAQSFSKDIEPTRRTKRSDSCRRPRPLEHDGGGRLGRTPRTPR